MKQLVQVSALLTAMLVGPGVAAAGEHLVVQSGESAAELAERAGVPDAADRILAHNGLPLDAPLPAGTVLELPPELGGEEQEALLLFARGTVTVTLPGATRAEPGGMAQPLPRDSLVCTGEDSHATVRLAVLVEERAHDDITLLPETCIAVASATARSGHRASLIRLQRGSVTVPEAEEQGGLATLSVQTQAGLTTAHAGGFRVHVEEAAARTEALTTPLRVLAQGVERQLDAGQGSRTRDGEAPGPAVDLLVGRALAQPPPGAPLRRPDFSWQKVEGALEYRVEMAGDVGFREMMRVEHPGLPTWTPERLMLPSRVHALWWRVAPVDRLGFVGLPSEAWLVSMPAGVGE